MNITSPVQIKAFSDLFSFMCRWDLIALRPGSIHNSSLDHRHPSYTVDDLVYGLEMQSDMFVMSIEVGGEYYNMITVDYKGTEKKQVLK